MQEGNVITTRFRIRSNLIKSDLKYIFYNGNKYKTLSVNDEIENHFIIIETGELI